MTWSIGIDVGATTIKAGLVDSRGAVSRRMCVPTRSLSEKEDIILCLENIIKELSNDFHKPDVGIGFCAMVDPDAGVILETTKTMPGLYDFPIVETLNKKTGHQCFCDNDGNVTALGEAIFGAGRRMSSLVMFTLGTGVGGGIIQNGQILQGAGYMAGHLGHIKVHPGKKICACGARGCLEAYASAYAFRRYYGEDAKDVFMKARKGNKKEKLIVDKAAEALGLAFAQVATITCPQVIVIGGGISSSYDMLEKRAMEAFKENSLRRTYESSTVVISKLGSDAGIIGAALLTPSFRSGPRPIE